jgi:hypothetical protein
LLLFITAGPSTKLFETGAICLRIAPSTGAILLRNRRSGAIPGLRRLQTGTILKPSRLVCAGLETGAIFKLLEPKLSRLVLECVLLLEWVLSHTGGKSTWDGSRGGHGTATGRQVFPSATRESAHSCARVGSMCTRKTSASLTPLLPSVPPLVHEHAYLFFAHTCA